MCGFIYNSRNYSILLNLASAKYKVPSTTVEIILYYLTTLLYLLDVKSTTVEIILYYLTKRKDQPNNQIYNSRNYSILLNSHYILINPVSTTVEIILYYLTVLSLGFVLPHLQQ